MTVDDMLDMVKIDDVVMTPDGTRVFYSERRLNWETNKYEKTLFMVSAQGGEPVPFVRKDAGEAFRVSPDGRHLSMLRKVEGKPQIFLMSLAGGEAWPLTSHRGKITDHKWSGDGQSIVFLAEEAMSEEDKKEFELGADPVFVNEGPNGKNHARWTNLWSADVRSRECRRVTDEALRIRGFDISPNSSRIVFAARPDGRGNFPFLSELYVVEGSGEGLERLTDNRTLEADPVWAPDGETFAFHASDEQEFDLRNGYLWVMDPDTGERRRMAGQNTGEIDHLVWAPDGGSLIFNEVHGTDTNLYEIDVASGNLEPLTRGTGNRRVLAYSRDRTKVAYTFDDFTTPPDLHASGLTGEDAVRLTRVNPRLETDILLPRARVMRWKSIDGTPIEGILMLPADHRAGTRLPLILEIHGGPSGYWGNSFEPELLIYTGLGYAVLGPNVRGSSGYGDELLRGLMGEVGGAEYHDLMTGVDAVVEAGHADPERMGVAGWSWGGVSAGWVITQTSRFKAASVGAGVSNWIAESGPGFNWDVAHWYIGGKHWTARDQWRERSAINHIEKVTTPTLFLHGAEDQTSSTNQSMVFFDALQERGVPTRFIKFPRQGHQIREPRLQRIRVVEEVRWMHRHVVGQEWTPWTRPQGSEGVERVHGTVGDEQELVRRSLSRSRMSR